jgi:uncharacterized protein YecE (DUF72 family)
VKVEKGTILKEYLIGAGGWAYFCVPRMHPLVAYSKAFSFVEVNSTFYQIPPPEEVETWRRLVPSDFKFAVRANRRITHELKLEPSPETLETFELMKQICDVLKANILHLLVPPSVSRSQTFSQRLKDFIGSVNLEGLRFALEIRGVSACKLLSDLVRVMQDHNVVHCVDLSKGEVPAYEGDILYSRLFGKGYHNVYQPTDEELAEIDKKAMSSASQTIVMSFHFVRMYKDAARLKIYKETGKFPKVTRSTGLVSLEEILSEDARFPATKEELINNQGWKLFDITEGKRAQAREFLQMIPKGRYNSITEVIEALKPTFR